MFFDCKRPICTDFCQKSQGFRGKNFIYYFRSNIRGGLVCTVGIFLTEQICGNTTGSTISVVIAKADLE